MKNLLPLGAVVVALLGIAMLLSWERPPVDSKQLGYRGLGMFETTNPRLEATIEARNQPPESFGRVEPGGGPARDTYENLQVLGNLSTDQFNQLMLSMTQWVSPEQGCNYCHNPENLASDEIYAKNVARTMLRMTQEVNSVWQPHVGATGVNCYSCHRGKPVPEYVWFDEEGPAHARGMSASRNDQNVASADVGLTSMPYTALEGLVSDASLRVISTSALPTGEPQATTQMTEKTYGLMIHMSEALGQNCTFCHNSRAFTDWSQSPPARTKAWQGIQMVRDINNNYLLEIADQLPKMRLGPQGDAPKASCLTCHQNVSKPLYRAPMLADHPELAAPQ